jgi:isopentenyl-diphosphate delta-isomerase
VLGKHAAHMRGLYHAAISIVLVDRMGRQLLQQRAFTKYHCGGMWSNACCSHQMAGESSKAAAERRLYDELRLRTPLTQLARVRYRSRVGRLVEHECVDLFVGLVDEAPRFNPKEVADVAWLSPGDPHARDPLTPWSALYIKLFGFEGPRQRALGLDDGVVCDSGPLFQL